VLPVPDKVVSTRGRRTASVPGQAACRRARRGISGSGSGWWQRAKKGRKHRVLEPSEAQLNPPELSHRSTRVSQAIAVAELVGQGIEIALVLDLGWDDVSASHARDSTAHIGRKEVMDGAVPPAHAGADYFLLDILAERRPFLGIAEEPRSFRLCQLSAGARVGRKTALPVCQVRPDDNQRSSRSA
jgi:hypothetical protein